MRHSLPGLAPGQGASAAEKDAAGRRWGASSEAPPQRQSLLSDRLPPRLTFVLMCKRNVQNSNNVAQ